MTWADYEPESYRMEIRGHAGAAPAGQDLVCAGISTLAFALINAAMSCEEYGGHVMVQGDSSKKADTFGADAPLIRVECCPEEGAEDRCREMFRTIWCGLQTLEENYPEYLVLTEGDG